ncbi:CPBP family intramembrane metalloprotease [bacterium]|nr:CPBP family intramembrane metalloprotease [bacterium]
MSKWACFGLGAAEYAVPGLGYAISGQWDKAIVIGGLRWASSSMYYNATESEYYQEDVDDIYEVTDSDDSQSGKTETIVRLTKETWTAQYYGNLYGNLLMITWGDLYQNGCQPNTETYSLMLSPFRIDHFYSKWQFWLPILVVAGNYSYFSEISKVDYFLDRGLTESDLKRDSFSEYYMVGVGEEMFFRGTVQHFFFELIKEKWGISPSFSRHLSVLSASAVFAAAHTGAGFTADPASAFLFGIYEGYVYHPSLDEFDLTTAIAIHAWWDIIISYAILNHADFHTVDADIRIPIFKMGFRF